MCWAAGSNDRSVSLWLTHSWRPLFVMEELFTGSVLDLSLQRNDGGGIDVAACSVDGTVCFLSLTKREIGELNVQPLVAEQQPAMAVATQAQATTQQKQETTKAQATTTQKQEKREDGRRRITPIFTPLS